MRPIGIAPGMHTERLFTRRPLGCLTALMESHRFSLLVNSHCSPVKALSPAPVISPLPSERDTIWQGRVHHGLTLVQLMSTLSPTEQRSVAALPKCRMYSWGRPEWNKGVLHLFFLFFLHNMLNVMHYAMMNTSKWGMLHCCQITSLCTLHLISFVFKNLYVWLNDEARKC